MPFELSPYQCAAHMCQLAHTVIMNPGMNESVDSCPVLTYRLTPETLGEWGWGIPVRKACDFHGFDLWDCGLTGRQRRLQQIQEDGQAHSRPGTELPPVAFKSLAGGAEGENQSPVT